MSMRGQAAVHPPLSAMKTISTSTLHIPGQPKDMEQRHLSLSGIDMSALLLTCLNCPALFFEGPLDAPLLASALLQLLQLYPALSGRIRKASRKELKSAANPVPYAISCCNAGVLFVDTSAGFSVSDVQLADLGRTGFAYSDRRHDMPPWFQDVNMSRLLLGKEPLLKVQLTHLSGGGCILALTLPHIIVDGHSSALLLSTLASLYSRRDTSALKAPAAPSCKSLLLPSGLAAAAQQMPQHQPCQCMPGKQDAADGGMEGGRPDDASSKKHRQQQHVYTPLPEALLKELSLAEQGVPRAGCCLQALSALGKAVAESLRSARRFPGTMTDLTTEVLRLSHKQLQGLKAIASQHGTLPAISTNDAVSALVWTAMCQLRGRPLPGSGGSGVLGLAVDLRQNGLKGQLPSDYFGNAAWALHVANDAGAASKLMLPGAGAGGQSQGQQRHSHQQQQQQQQGGEEKAVDSAMGVDSGGVSCDPSKAAAASTAVCGFEGALQAGAACVRGALQRFRGHAGSGAAVVDLAYAQHKAPLAVTVRNLAGLAVHQDAFLTSWQFDIYTDFGGSAGRALLYQCITHPTPPWQAAAAPAHPDDPAGGLYLFVTVPTSAVAALRSSAVIAALAPGARWA